MDRQLSRQRIQALVDPRHPRRSLKALENHLLSYPEDMAVVRLEQADIYSNNIIFGDFRAMDYYRQAFLADPTLYAPLITFCQMQVLLSWTKQKIINEIMQGIQSLNVKEQAECFVKLGYWLKKESYFHTAIKCDPECWEAYWGLSRRCRKNPVKEAEYEAQAERIQRAIGYLPPENPQDSEGWNKWWTRGFRTKISDEPSRLVDYDSLLPDSMEFLVSHNYRTTLVIGAGIELGALALKEAGFHVTAIDISSVAIDYLRQYTDFEKHAHRYLRPEQRRPGGTIEYQVADFLDPTVAPGPFDVIVASNVLHYYTNESKIDEAIAAVANRISPDGTLVVRSQVCSQMNELYLALGKRFEVWWQSGGKLGQRKTDKPIAFYSTSN